ncbi:MAG TPA: DUF4256 domain-containing protein [Chitinophagales bacterium]|nr:DUF4256 domain-containing protein [Chitinophagales bacterium]HRK26464.1 DUF4256 domain-containing protein [Chitinophagales bacterium]
MENKTLTLEQTDKLLQILQSRFEKNMHRHNGLDWQIILTKLTAQPEKLWSIHEMEATGGEPDVVGYDSLTNEYIFCDCAPETPKLRRNLCYDRQAQDARTAFKPDNNAVDMAAAMGITLLNEEQYRNLQKLGVFDAKTSSWIITPPQIRQLGGALFADYRYGAVFVYHNGAQSYYSSRGFRGLLRV